MPLTEIIREHVRAGHVEPARAQGKRGFTVSANEIAEQLGIRDRFPAICNAMDARVWRRAQNLELLDRRAPAQSSTVVWVFGFSSPPTVSGGPNLAALRGRIVRVG
jgi:hypothetical protein